jgi:hypothetical protein
MSNYAVESGATSVVALEYDQTALTNAKPLPGVTPLLVDADNFLTWSGLSQFDVVMCLSFIGTRELTNPIGITSRAIQCARKVLYLEGHNNVPYQTYMTMLLRHSTFTQIEYRGVTYDAGAGTNAKGRVFIRASRETVDIYDLPALITNLLTKKENRSIAVIGHGGAGKSTICDALVTTSTTPTEKRSSNKYQTNCQFNNSKPVFVGDDITTIPTSATRVVLFSYSAMDILHLHKRPPDVVIHVRRRNHYIRPSTRLNHREPSSIGLEQARSIYTCLW